MQNLTESPTTGIVNASVTATAATETTPTTPSPATVPPSNQKGAPMKRIPTKTVALVSILVIVAGSATGWTLYGLIGSSSSSSGSDQAIQQIPGAQINAGDVFGSNDTETFPDTAEGFLQAGGIDGEGSHSLLRPGGPSQTVYLTSSVTDLDKLVNMQVIVWGETYKGQQAGWLMDVGRVEVVDPNASAPEATE